MNTADGFRAGLSYPQPALADAILPCRAKSGTQFARVHGACPSADYAPAAWRYAL